MSRVTLPLCLMLAVAACATNPPEPWQNVASGGPPDAGDTSRCRGEARWQARNRYPPQVVRDREGGSYKVVDSSEFPAEIRFYEQCMSRLGYRRVPA